MSEEFEYLKLRRGTQSLAGQRFGRLTVLGPVRRVVRNLIYRCLCDCGEYTDVYAHNLRNGGSQSCGCRQREITSERAKKSITHGLTKSRTYSCWHHMLQRCNNPNTTHYHRYGGRGITHCAEWIDFNNFYRDMGTCPPGYTLERKNNELGYCKDNCCWASRATQGNNRSSNRHVTYAGRTMTLMQAVRLTGQKYSTVRGRLKKGWSLVEALNTPAYAKNGSAKRHPSPAG